MSRRRRVQSPAALMHADWLGMVQPEGLVVSIPVLVDNDVYVKLDPTVQNGLRALAPDDVLPDRATFDRVLTDVLGWQPARLVSGEAFAIGLPDLHVTLRPDAALVDKDGGPLVLVAWTDGKLDDDAGEKHWPVTKQARFERLLLEGQTATGGTPIGVHACPSAIRLTYAPRGEAPGSLTFPIDALCAWDGRLLVDALVMLLGRDRLFNAPADRRLAALLAASRKRQEQVTTELAGQVEEALALLVAGLDVANQRTQGALLRGIGDLDDPVGEVRAGLVSVLLRLVFLLYCEDTSVLPLDHALYYDNYALDGLVEQLEDDAVLYPEAMRHRYGAWARLSALFRLVHRGVNHGSLRLPARQGELFDPDRHPWLEGRATEHHDAAEPPPIDDGVVLDVLERLVYLEHQRLSYRNLDVEQIGSVYEALMGLDVRRCASRTVPVRPNGWLELGPILDAENPARAVAEVLGMKPAELAKKAKGLAAFVATGDRNVDEPALLEALAGLLDPKRTERKPGEHVVVAGAERRRSGSHYTPTSLTRPIVERTLAPVLDRDGPPSSAFILSLKVCDPAMGSGAFLAEACRYLARRLLDAWAREGKSPTDLFQRDPLLFARRMVAEKCLYGVDKNPFAVQLARLSLWLVTLAKELPFTFVDHALREGDAVIGLTVRQIADFSFVDDKQEKLVESHVRKSIKDAIKHRAYILEPTMFDAHDPSWGAKRRALTNALDEVELAGRRGNLLLADAWLGGPKKAAKERRGRLVSNSNGWFEADEKPMSDEAKATLDALPMKPFHWELEFPEVFADSTRKDNPGFDAVVGNPPFGGKNVILAMNGDAYINLFQGLQPHAHGNADFCAWFFLRAADVLRKGGCFGLVATNTIKQGDTRATGLQHMVANGIALYDARTDAPWPVLGGAAVVVDVVHGSKGALPKPAGISVRAEPASAKWTANDAAVRLGVARLNDMDVASISSSLTAGEEQPNPVALRVNADKAFQGTVVLGTGFVLSLPDARPFLDDAHAAQIVTPYIGGEELNTNLVDERGYVMFDRYVVDFGDRSLSQAGEWPKLLALVTEKVKPSRDTNNRANYRDLWWQFGERRPGAYRAIRPLSRCLATSLHSKHHLFAFQPAGRVFSHGTAIFAFDDDASFAVLQSRVHEAWVRHAGLTSTMKTDTRYTPSTCFETFPFPRPTEPQRVACASAGEALDAQRTACMRKFGEGMTRVWNRLMDPDHADHHDADIDRLRALRDAMDRAVLAAYGWSDLEPTDTAAIVRRLRALNVERAAEEARKT